MSTLKTHNLQSPDAGSANIALTSNAGMVVAGVSTLGFGGAGGVDLRHQDVSRLSTQSYGVAINGNITIAEEIVHGGDTDTRIKFPAADTITAETAGGERLRITSIGKVGINTDNPSRLLEINTTGTSTEGIVVRSHDNTYPKLQFGANRTNADAFLGLILASWDGTDVASIHFETGSDTTNKDDGLISFRTASAGTREERLRITGDGNIGIGTTNPTEQLVIYKGVGGNPSGNTTFRMRSDTSSTMMTLDARGTNSSSYIYFTSGTQAYDAFLQLKHNYSGDHWFRFCHNGSAHETFRIHSSGALGLGGANYGTAGQVLKSNGSSAVPSWSGGAQRVLEVVASPCDGSTIATSNGNVTFQNVTAQQNLSTTYADVNGSSITYQPPSGTIQVIYEFNMQVTNHDDAISIAHLRFYLDGTEVVYHRRNASGEDIDDFVNFKYIINIGGSANTNTGRIASWSNAKEMKMTAREYHGSNNAISLHTTDHWNGSSTNQFSQPVLQITAIGV